jgi:diacylglycerol kinase (ATP)
MKSEHNAPTSDPNEVRKTVGIVVNPTAGLGKGEGVGRRVMAEFRRRGFQVLDLSAENARDALARARAACLTPVDALVVVGGDGMVHLGVNAVIGTPTPLGIVPAGSGNDFARALDLSPRKQMEAIDRIVQALGSNSIAEMDAVQVEPYVLRAHVGRLKIARQSTKPFSESVRRWYVGTLSVGLDAAVNAQANEYKWPKGHLKYLRAVFASVPRFKPYGYSITIDGKKFESTGTLAAISNAPMFGGGIPISPGADMADGKLEVTFAKALNVSGILKVFPKLYKGTHVDDPAVMVYSGKEIIIEPSESGAFPPVAMADGEVIGPVPLKVVVHPGVLRILR